MQEGIYLKIRKVSLRYNYFLFFDTSEYLADQLFIRQKVRVWFDEECCDQAIYLATTVTKMLDCNQHHFFQSARIS